jgi:predicted nucleic acid-binding protein
MERARELVNLEVHALDAAHVASAEEGESDCFLTCDDRLIRRVRRLDLKFLVVNPVEYQEKISNG